MEDLRQTSSSTGEPVEVTLLMKEESFSWYTSGKFYAVHIGDVFKSRYQVLGTLEYGSVSTAWLCRDLEYARRPLLPRALTIKTRQLGSTSM